MSEPPRSWPAQSFLEGLRPGPDETVELALLASYSADLGSIGAALLALAGKDNDAGRGSPSDFADAIEKLRGKVRIVIQRGRLAKMRRTPRIAAVLDQFVREVDFDEAFHSWHAKAALVRMRGGDTATNWRLWIGSRNLTECMNRDIGLLLTSDAKKGAMIGGADDLARAIAEKAALKGIKPASLAAAVGQVAWRAPAGVRVERIRWTSGLGDAPVPTPPAGTDEIVIVSPFIDKTFLALQRPAGAKAARCVLLTTRREIERAGPALACIDELLALDAPDYPTGDPAPDTDDEAIAGAPAAAEHEGEEAGRGLHAKLLFLRSGRKRKLWLGSANATMRAWSGRNVEVTAELAVDEAVEMGLRALCGSARMVDLPAAELALDSAELAEQALERARAQVAARWAGELGVDDDGLFLSHRSEVHPAGPHPDHPGTLLEVATLRGALAAWPRGQTKMHMGAVAPDERSEFVRLRVSCDGKGLSWLQRAPANPPFGQDRDRAAFLRVLGVRGFLLWLAGLLNNYGTQDEEDWTRDERQERSAAEINPATDSSLPTLEEMLAAWARNPHEFADIDRRVGDYLPALLAHAELEEPQAAKILRDFARLWTMLRAGLGEPSARGACP
jgi:hypothetical protein